MKKTLYIIFISVFAFAIEVNQDIELTQYMNARYSANFTKDDKNIAAQLPTGSKGNVQEIKTFSSGNSGFLILVKDGELKGQKVWVYYNKQAPSLKLIDEKQQPTTEPAAAEQVQTTMPTPVLREPVTSRSVLGQLDQINQDLAKLKSDGLDGKSDCAACDKNSPGQSGGLPESSMAIATSMAANGNINARIKCSHKSDQGMTLAGAIQLEIINNKVKNINATIKGCSVTLKNFKQKQFNNSNIVLEDSNGCAVVISENLKVKGSSAPVLNFGMVPISDCVKSCAKVEKSYWQVEMNPNTQTCY